MSTYAKVRRLRLRDGLPIAEIARKTGLSRNTIKAWLCEPLKREMAYRRPPGPKKLDDFAPWLQQALATDARRPRKERRTALRLYARLQEARIVNARFAAMTAHYLFDPDFCNVAAGWEKGRVEKGVQDNRRRIWQLTQEQQFGSFAELNVWLATQLPPRRGRPSLRSVRAWASPRRWNASAPS